MAKQAAKKRGPGADDGAEGGEALARKIAGLLAMLVTKDMEKEDASVRLSGVGFTDREIAGILSVTEGYVRLSRFRSKGARKTGKRKAS